jgi:hypothetical protein
MKKITIEDGVYPDSIQTDENEIMKNGWSIRKEGDKFLLNYISGEISGALKSIAISKKDYELAKNDKLSLDELARIYGFS